MLYANDPFERAGFDALDLDGQIAHQVSDTPEIEDLEYLIVNDPVDYQLEQVDQKIYHGWH